MQPEFLKKINVIVNVLPLTEENKFLLNKHSFNNCNDGTFLINVARGEHIIDKDLINAINSKKNKYGCFRCIQSRATS